MAFLKFVSHLGDMGSNYGENVFHLSCTHPEIFPVPLRMSTELLYQIVVIPLLLSLLVELVHPNSLFVSSTVCGARGEGQQPSFCLQLIVKIWGLSGQDGDRGIVMCY